MGLLDRVTTEAPQQPSRVYLYAAEKWGKTSFAAHAPKPIFLMTSGETGLLDLINYGQIGPTPHFPEDFKRWPDLLDAIDALVTERHDYKTLVLDTANGAERLLADYVLHTEFGGMMGGENGYGSYGKGDLACIPHWAELLRRLDRVRNERSMSILLLAHSKVKSVNNPEGDDYDQLRPEGIDKLWPLTHKWASVIGAGTYKVVVKDDKAAGGRERVIKLQGSAAVVSGNRYGLPEQVSCGGSSLSAWSAFAKVLTDAKRAAAKKAAALAATSPPPVQAPAPQQPAPAAPAAQQEGEQGSDFTPKTAAKSSTSTATTDRAAEDEDRSDFKPRFEAKFEKAAGCWEWLGSVHHSGYGQFSLRGKPELAHRVSYQVYCGEISDGMQVLHRCDNRRCVRPDHLFLGTHTDNMRDMAEKGRGDPGFGEESNFAKLTEAAVADIRARYRRVNHSKSNARELAREYGVTKGCIIHAVTGKTWAKSLTDDDDESQYPVTDHGASETQAPTEPAPRPMPAAERRNAPVPAASGSAASREVQDLLALLHELDLSWTEVSGRRNKGGEIALAAKLPAKLGHVTALTLPERNRLRTVLMERVALKRERADKRAEAKARREHEEALEMVSAS